MDHDHTIDEQPASQDEPATLELSDVVHDETIDDEVESSLTPNQPSPIPDYSSPSESYAVEIFQREIVTLLSQNASAASAALLCAVAEQRQESPEANTTMDLGLAAALRAANAHNSPTDTEFSRQLRPGDEPKTTRSAPAFHSLTESHQTSKRSDFLYTNSEQNSEDGLPDAFSLPRRASTPQMAELAEMDHMLTQFATRFEPENRPPSPDDFLERDDSQPVASTSALPTPKAKEPHVCDHDQCNKSFNRRSDLIRHTRIHTGERPFPCEHPGCGKSFIQRSALHVHQRVHTGEKPHSCEYPRCGKTFGDSSSLARHRRTHTGKRPYKCEEMTCEKTFTRRTTLTQHMRTHDPSWEPDPNVRYSFKPKRRKHCDDEFESEDDDLADSVRTISAIFQTEERLEVKVASIGAEIAAALAQSRTSRVFDEQALGPNTSGIRDEEDDSDASFPLPLRRRKGTDNPSKRKRL
ncbi:hypothetical protein MIND_01031300 [Mycena indigotica]|uniref:C2H2-type domain-containing protein n=1 Tax=Mycena indigotica TaxID=2126181 RepID=A0A8H6VV14_9AGAR|nr:uncharacterized protein MIND_01031300 [Mycena indigotica]KAF7294932.1 hypothetical protein MIND_01031300 [Mycena indigotica]